MSSTMHNNSGESQKHNMKTIRRMHSSGTDNVYLDGRPPWYTRTGTIKTAYLIGVAGGTASGKTSVCKKIIEELNVPWVVLLSHDSFYKSLEGEDLEKAARNEYDFDHPDAIDNELCAQTLAKLKEGHAVNIPIYDFKSHTSTGSMEVYGADVIIFEGIMSFCVPELLELMDMKIFVDTDADIRLCRRLRRDCRDRGRDPIGVLAQYERWVKPGFDNHIAPTMNKADVIIPRGAENTAAIELITEEITTILEARGVYQRKAFAKMSGECLPDTLHVINNNQVQFCQTIIRNTDTDRQTFIFYADRLTRMLLEEALDLAMDYDSWDVETPTGDTYKGLKGISKVCAVSVVRAGETMEESLRMISKDIRIGKILIQQQETKYANHAEPALFYYKLPEHIEEFKVILMDPTLGSGATAIMAVRVLLDHGVEECNIVFASLIAATPGVQALSYIYPKITIVTTEVDEELNEKFWIIPGVGNFGSRYFGA